MPDTDTDTDTDTNDAEMQEMKSGEIDDFLNETGDGVIAFSKDGQPYSVPISIGYTDNKIYLKFGYRDGSKKKKYLEANKNVSVTTYETTEDTKSTSVLYDVAWRSVVVQGTLHEVEDPEAIDAALETHPSDADNPWGLPRAEVEFEVYRLEIDEITGRKAGM
ncbi:MAG: pyridoxamine 5'-phosphate oxidase family protein [Halobacteria archaeon]|nr:pyridoxamine 5'-phosphate oxidase family protein [Halobacteria archaeon]